MVGPGRGRGRGSQMTGVEQMGFGVGESMPTPVLQPPPLYPPLENRPVPLRWSPEDQYCVELRSDFIESLHDSPAYLVARTVRSDIERYSDRYQTVLPSKSRQQRLTYPVANLPLELRPVAAKKKTQPKDKKTSTVDGVKAVDITSRLEELEKTEGQLGDAEEEEEEKESEEKGDEDAEDKDVEELEDPDEEMDDGTDYVNNYFDNGEGFLDDDDDNLDDGPVY